MSKKALGYTLLTLAALCCAAARAGAQDDGGNPANWCRNGAFTRDSGEFGLARVAARKGERVHFHGDDEGCPGPSAKCRQKAYLLAGDEVIVSRTFGDWRCVWYQPARGAETVGWLPADRLRAAEPPARQPLAAWLGSWAFYGNALRVTRGRTPGALLVEGNASWVGANPGNVHVGEFLTEGPPAGNTLRLGGVEEECVVTLRLVGPYLVASDNRQCGGLNVSFDGVYRRKKGRQ